jgi:hypothetical protein
VAALHRRRVGSEYAVVDLLTITRIGKDHPEMSSFFRNIFSYPAFWHILIVLGLITIVNFGQKASVRQVESKADEWVDKIKIEDPGDTLAIPSGFNASDSEKGRLLQQVRMIRGRAYHHFAVMKYFYAQYYMAISIVMVSGVIAALALLFITKNGWDSANQYVKTVFITAAALTAYFGTFPQVFQQSQNIADNKKLYIQYVALHDEVMSYLPLQQGIDGKPKTVSEFIHYLDKQLVQLNTFAIGFDDTKVPNYKGAFNAN